MEKKNIVRILDAIPILLRRILTILFLVVLVGFVGLGFLARCNTVEEPPTVKEAPWLIQTDSRIYYAKEFRLSGETPEIKGYWTFDGKRYEFKEGIKDFPKALFGSPKIIKRTR